MTSYEKFRRIFGQIYSLEEQVPWTTGISSMLEHHVWDTKSILGISKTKLVKHVIELSTEEGLANLTVEEKNKKIAKILTGYQGKSDTLNKYNRPKSVYCSPREAMRRNKFFSEDYLNKEFDIFMGLSSDSYIDSWYSKFLDFEKGNSWSCHGNSGLFVNSTEIIKMQMDNLAYNAKSKVLVANELKLGGSKNKDQILKYCYLLRELQLKGFIGSECDFLLLFIGDKHDDFDSEREIEKGIQFCKNEGNKKHLLSESILHVAKNIKTHSFTWKDLMRVNNGYMSELNTLQQVEKKLISGFNSTLSEKAFMQQ